MASRANAQFALRGHLDDYVIADGHLCIPVGSRYALIDTTDFELVWNWRWHLDAQGYAARSEHLPTGKRKGIYMHRSILAPPPGMEVDHINGDRLDNRRANLRLATRAENAQNVRANPGKYSKYRGVSWNARRGKWIAQVRHDGRNHQLGYFDDELTAAHAAQAFRALHMPFARREVIP